MAEDFVDEIMEKIFPELKPADEDLKKRVERKAAKASQV